MHDNPCEQYLLYAGWATVRDLECAALQTPWDAVISISWAFGGAENCRRASAATTQHASLLMQAYHTG